MLKFVLKVLLFVALALVLSTSSAAEPSMKILKDEQTKPVSERYVAVVVGVDEYLYYPEASEKAAGFEEAARQLGETLVQHGGADTVVLLMNAQAELENYKAVMAWLRERGLHRQLLLTWVGLAGKKDYYNFFLLPNTRSDQYESAVDISVLVTSTWGAAERTAALLLIPPDAGTVDSTKGEKLELTGLNANDWRAQNGEPFFAFSPGEDARCAQAVAEMIGTVGGSQMVLNNFLSGIAAQYRMAQEPDKEGIAHCGERPVVSQQSMLMTDLFLPAGAAAALPVSVVPEPAPAIVTVPFGEPMVAPTPSPAPDRKKPPVGPALLAGAGTFGGIALVETAIYASRRNQLASAGFQEYPQVARKANTAIGVAGVTGVLAAVTLVPGLVVTF